MFKIVSTEIKKIVSKPGIYILSLLLAIILVLGAFIYKPTVYKSSRFELLGDTYIEKYTDFCAGENAGQKAKSLSDLNAAIKSITDYTITYNYDEYSQKEYINLLLKNFDDNYYNYFNCQNDESTQSIVNARRDDVVTSLTNLNTAIENALLNSQNGTYSLLTSKDNYKKYKETYKEVLKWSKLNISVENLKNHFIEFENKYSENFYSAINNFKYPKLSESFITNYTINQAGSRLNTLQARLNKIWNEITENYEIALNNSAFNMREVDKMDVLANKYVETINTYTGLIKYELLTNAFSDLSTNEQLSTLHLSKHSEYNAKSHLERFDYMFKHNKSENDLGRPLTIGVTSNDSINAYDYAYFVLKIFSFVIIIYSIMAACHSIAGEIKEGSMRYLAIRPVSRTKMFFGKWLSILLMSTILIIFSTIIATCVGGAVYGFETNSILTIFNGTHAFTIHPLGMIAIYLVSMLLELIVYSIIAMMLSTIFKSDLVSTTILIVIYLLNILLPIFVQGSNTWLAFYPFSHISLYSLFGSALYAVPTNFFNLIFGAKVYAGTHIALTSSIILILTVIISFISVKVLKKKEL